MLAFKENMAVQTRLMQRFQRDGFHLVRGLLSPDRVANYIGKIKSIVENPAERVHRAHDGMAHIDGITLRPDFWELIFESAIGDTVRKLIGPDIMYVRHSDIHWNIPTYPGWHRDTTMAISEIAARDRLVPYRVVRPLIYLTETKFAILADSHLCANDRQEVFGNHMMRILRRVGYPHLVTPGKSVFLHLMPGDCLFINVLCVHSGLYANHADHPKVGTFLAFGQKNQNSIDHSRDYGARSGLPMPDELERRLRAADLWHDTAAASKDGAAA